MIQADYKQAISIHALVKRATAISEYYYSGRDISIHALVKRATYRSPTRRTIPKYFNPRPREEGDDFRYTDGSRINYFNPRPREEGDCVTSGSTASTANFNPRPREEGDTIATPSFCAVIISIHALVKRATRSSGKEHRVQTYFNPRPREEGDLRIPKTPSQSAISIHALVKRATGWSLLPSSNLFISIHALVKRATINIHGSVFCERDFNPRPREEGDYLR